MKKIFWYVLLIFIGVVVVSLIVFVDKKVNHTNKNTTNEKTDKLNYLNNIDKKIDYFNYQYLDRYVDYKKYNTTLSDVDVITRVNLNLDVPYYQNTRQSTKLNKTDILVNKYIYLPSDYVPNNLTELSSKFTDSNKLLVYEAKEAFEKMATKAKEDGYNLRVISAYRSYEYQTTLYDNYVKKDGVDKADKYSARPGHSEHQTGLVIDIDNISTNYENFESTEEFKWMMDNSYKYGFILRYPEGKENITGYDYESWHYRYVGEKIANFIVSNNLTFDEYYVRYIDK